jgi:hypothetical protein
MHRVVRHQYLEREPVVPTAAGLLMEDLMRGDKATFKAGYSKQNAALAAHEVFPELDLELLETMPITDREKCEQYAGLVFNVGTMIEDRLSGSYVAKDGDLSREDSDRLWAHLWENCDEFYELFGPAMDEIQEELFPEEESDLGVSPSGPETAEGGLIGQQPY